MYEQIIWRKQDIQLKIYKILTGKNTLKLEREVKEETGKRLLTLDPNDLGLSVL